MKLHCQVCAADCDQTFAVSNGHNLMSVCRNCKGLTPLQMYDVLQRRCDEMADNCRAMANESHRTGDQAGFKEAQETLEYVLKTKREMWKPGEPQ